MSPGLGLWLAEPATLGDVGTSMFPELGLDSVGKLMELVADALWALGLNLLGF